MRILVAADAWFPDHRGGAARVAAETAAALARRSHDIEVLAPTGRGLPGYEQLGSLSVHRTLHRSALPHTLTDVWATRRAVRQRTGPRPDVTLAHATTVAVGVEAARLQTPLALVYHASAAREIRFERSRLAAGRRRAATYALEPALALLERHAVAQARRILVLSEFSRSLLAADHPEALERVRLVRGGVDTAAFSPGDARAARRRLGLAEDAHLLVTVRRLEPRMGLDRLLDALAALRASDPRLELAIVGDGPLLATLERQRAVLRLDDAVRLVGRVPDRDLVDWYRAADLFVLPTLAYEGFGLVTAEALACGTPVVGTPVGATPELLRPLDERLLARGTDAAELREAIAGVLALTGPELRHRCRAHAEAHLSWEYALDGWEGVLGELIVDVRPMPSGSSGRGSARSAAVRSLR